MDLSAYLKVESSEIYLRLWMLKIQTCLDSAQNCASGFRPTFGSGRNPAYSSVKEPYKPVLEDRSAPTMVRVINTCL